MLNVSLPCDEDAPSLDLLLSTSATVPGDVKLRANGYHYRLWRLNPGECRIYVVA